MAGLVKPDFIDADGRVHMTFRVAPYPQMEADLALRGYRILRCECGAAFAHPNELDVPAVCPACGVGNS